MKKDKKILIVDDEPDVSKYLTVVLNDNGFQTTSVNGASEALEKIKTFKPDLICLDIMMPQHSGIWLYLKLKSDEKLSVIPIIIISGIKEEKEFNFRELVPDRQTPPPEAFIEKPIKVENFIETVRRLIDAQGNFYGR